MRCRAGWTPFIILVPITTLVVLIGLWVNAAVGHTFDHLPEVLEAQLAAVLRREVQIGKLEGSLRHGLVIHDVAVARTDRLADGALLRIRRARVRYSLEALLYRTAPPLECIRAIEIEDPWLYLSRDARGRLNLQELMPPGPPKAGPPARFPTTVVVRGGTILFEDHRVPRGRPLTHRLTGIELFFDGRAAPLYSLSLKAEGDGRRLARLALQASADPEAKSVSALAQAEGLNLAAWLAYVPPGVRLPVQIQGGSADVNGSVALVGGKLVDYQGRVTLRDGAVRAPQLGQPVSGIAGTFDISPDSLVARNVRLTAGRIALRGSATVVDFARPWVRARLTGSGIREADLRALAPNLPALPEIRLGRFDNVEVTAVGPLTGPQARLRFDLTSLARPEAAATGIHAEARLLSQRRFLVETLTARVAGGTVAGTGSVELTKEGVRYAASAAVRGVALGRLSLPGLTPETAPDGTVSADLQAHGVGARLQAEARVDVRGARWREWHAHALQAECAYQDSVLVVKQAQARAPEGLLSAQGTVDLRGPIKLQLAATEVDVTTLAQRFRLDPLHGKAFLRGEVSGELADPRFQGELAAYDLGWAEYTLEMLRANVAGSLQEVRIEECRGFMLPAQMGNVAVTVTDPRAGPEAEIAATGTIIGIDLAQLGERLKLAGQWHGTVDVEELEVTGPLNAPEVAVRVTARNLEGAGQEIDEVTGRVVATVRLPEKEGEPPAVAIRVDEADPVVATVLGGGRGARASSQVRVWGTVSPDQRLDLRVASVEGRPLRSEHFYRPDPKVLTLTSELGIDLRVTGTLTEPEVRGGMLTVERMVVNGHEFGKGGGPIYASKDSVRIDHLVLITEERALEGGQAPAGNDRQEQYELDGTVWPELNLTARVIRAPIPKLMDLARVEKPAFGVEGKVTALIRIQAAEPAPAAAADKKAWPRISLAQLQVEEGQVGPQRIAELTAKGIALTGDTVTLESLHLGLPEGATLDVTGKASLSPDGPLEFWLAGEKLDLALLQPWVKLPAPIRGVGTLKETTLSGTLRHPVLAGSLTIAAPGYGAVALDHLSADFGFGQDDRGRQVAQVTNLLAEKDQYTVSGFVKVPLEWQELATARPAETDAGERPEVVASDARIEGQVILAERDLTGLALLSPLVLHEEAHTLALERGHISGRLDVGGTFAQPDLRGGIQVRCPMLVLGRQPQGQRPEPGLYLWGIDGSVTIEPGRVVIEHARVASAGWPKKEVQNALSTWAKAKETPTPKAEQALGRAREVLERFLSSLAQPTSEPALELAGELTLAGFTPDQLDLRLAARGFEIREENLSGLFKEKVAFALNGSGTVKGSWAAPLVAGDFELRGAKIDLSRFVPPPPAEQQRKFPVNPRFAVSVQTREAQVLAPRTNAVVTLTSRLEGTLSEPLLQGTVTASRGSVNIHTAHFRVKEANVDFRVNQANGELAQAVTATGQATLTTNLRGRNPRTGKEDSFAVDATVVIDYPSQDPSRPPIDMDLEARPFLEESEIWPLLVRTDVIESLLSGRGDTSIEERLKNEAITYMSTALQPYVVEPVERAVAEYLGLSEFSIKASFTEPMEVKLGKHLVKGLRVSYERAVTARDARYTFKVDYEVMPRVSVSWSTDEKDSRTVGLEAGLPF
ncbi:MAG: DUF748 domain-containing protein [Armatimonadetes bacterium]|nr:DUF748 domain-containing protein [Armatimonadota bacterium]